jgi:hypothetical protein
VRGALVADLADEFALAFARPSGPLH